jgi:hypothetical protein
MHETRGRRRLLRKPSIEEEITVLRDLDLKGLRVRWRNAFGKPAPGHLTRYLLFRINPYGPNGRAALALMKLAPA